MAPTFHVSREEREDLDDGHEKGDAMKNNRYISAAQNGMMWLSKESKNRVTVEKLKCPTILVGFDLQLGLSSPKPKLEASKSSPSQSSSTSDEDMGIAHLFESEESQESTLQIPSLIAMGCTRCYMYVLVSDADPRCPKCNTSSLLNIFREIPSRKFKTNSTSDEDMGIARLFESEGSQERALQIPSLIAMGCTRCYMYVLVSDVEPKCPKCNTSSLLDIFREIPSRKFKTN